MRSSAAANERERPWITLEPIKKKWLPNMDSNHDKQIQSLLCYRYTIRQA